MALINGRMPQELITSFTRLTLTEQQFRTNIEDSIMGVSSNCDRLNRDKAFTLSGDAEGTGTVTGGFISGSGAQTVTIPVTLTTDSVITDNITALNVTRGKIAGDAIDNSKLADNAVQTENIVDLNVTTGKLASDAVDNSKLADNAVQTENITDLNVTTGKLAADAVDNSKLADNAVQTENITDDAVTNAKLADNAVQIENITDAAVNSIRTGSVSHSTLTTTTIPALSMDIPFYSVHLNPSGTGTINVTVPVGMFEGQTINVTATRGMDITWSGGDSQGIGLANSARIASGIWRTGGWYFSETVV